MTLSHRSKVMLVILGLTVMMLQIITIAAFARPGANIEFINRSHALDYERGTSNYDREVNGSDASTPGHN